MCYRTPRARHTHNCRLRRLMNSGSHAYICALRRRPHFLATAAVGLTAPAWTTPSAALGFLADIENDYHARESARR